MKSPDMGFIGSVSLRTTTKEEVYNENKGRNQAKTKECSDSSRLKFKQGGRV